MVQGRLYVCAKKLMCASWTIQPGQRLAAGPERNSAYEEVTNHAKPEER